jgi:hypothetical protein
VIFYVRLPHSPQVLHSGSNGSIGETSGMKTDEDEGRRGQVVMMFPA